MHFLKGPKALLSSAIAEALAEYFVVGVDQIESNLLTDTKIVLKDVRLKPRHFSIPLNTFEKTTDLWVTGFVREVSFTWSWDIMTSDSESWIKDAVLLIKGCRFKVRLTQEDIINSDSGDDSGGNHIFHTRINNTNTYSQNRESPSELQSEVDEKTAQTSTIEDRIHAYLARQVQLVVDALTVTIEDFEIMVEMPSPTILSASTKIPSVSVLEDPQEEGNIEIVEVEAFTSSSNSEAFATDNTNDNNEYSISIKLGVRELNILSYGRYCFDNDETLKQKISFSSLFINVTEHFHYIIGTTSDSGPRKTVICKTYPLQHPFSYSLAITRTHGERFSDIGRGLIVKGGQQLQFDIDPTNSPIKKDNEGLSFLFSRPQIEAIGQLSGLILAPREETVHKETLTGTTKISNNVDATTRVGDVSIYDISFDSVNVDVMGSILSATGINLSYLADGSDLSAKVESSCYEEIPSETKRLGTSITFSNIIASAQPCIEIIIGSVSELYVPYVVELRAPIENVIVRLIGETWTADIDSFDGYLPAHEVEPERSSSPTEHAQNSNKQSIPFPVACNVKHIFLVKEEDEETEIAFADVEILMNPKSDQSSTELACSVRSMESKLASANNINTCMVIPSTERDTNTIRDFSLSLDSISVTAGYTIQDWMKTFRIGGKWRRTRNKNDTLYFKLPHASVAPLKTTIAYDAMRVVSVRETTILVNAYKGKQETTAKDLLEFYTVQCLARTPDFLQNAELLGINVKDSGAFSLGATLGGMAGPIVHPIAPFVGVAAVVGVDAIRGSIEAGKRSRRAKEGEAAKSGDFFRGIGYSAVEATRKGKLRRGSEGGRGNVVDWMVGATVNTGDYIGKNKDTLGSAGGAGAGVLVGTILGGPVGAVIGGVVGGMTTGTAIRRIDKRIKKVIKKGESKYERKKSKYERKKLKPGKLALSPFK